jgi:hypothetical protein
VRPYCSNGRSKLAGERHTQTLHHREATRIGAGEIRVCILADDRAYADDPGDALVQFAQEPSRLCDAEISYPRCMDLEGRRIGSRAFVTVRRNQLQDICGVAVPPIVLAL